MEPAGALEFGDYQLLEKLGAGGMAEIHRARIHGPGGFRRDVAIKRILPHLNDEETFVHMLLDEARIAARLSHPNIVQVLNCGCLEGTYFIVMEYVHGGPLSRILPEKRSRWLSSAACFYVANALLRALDCAHRLADDEGNAMGLVHRDVSPQNILVSVDGDVKLSDFGIAKAAGKLHQTTADVVRGKLSYMAPEQLRGNTLDNRVDQYAAALVVFRMLTGRSALAGDSAAQIMYSIFNGFTEDLGVALDKAGAPAGLEAVLRRALAQQPDNRFDSCDDFRKALAPFCRDLDLDAVRRELGDAVAATTDPSGAGPLPRSENLVERQPSAKQATCSTRRLLPKPNDLASAPVASGAGRPTRSRFRVMVASVITTGLMAGLWYMAGNPGHPSAVDAPLAPMAVALPAETPVAATASGKRPDHVSPPQAGATAFQPNGPKPDNSPALRQDEAPTAGARPAQGSLEVACLPWCEIRVDGALVAQSSPLRDHSLDVGPHSVEVFNPPSQVRREQQVSIVEGKKTRVNFRLR